MLIVFFDRGKCGFRDACFLLFAHTVEGRALPSCFFGYDWAFFMTPGTYLVVCLASNGCNVNI